MRTLILTAAALALGATACAGSTTTLPVDQPPVDKPAVANVSVALSSSSLVVGQSAHAAAILKDASGNALSGRALAWQSSNTSVATVTPGGDVTAIAAGSATISASSEGQSGSAALTVSAPAPAPVASVTVTPATPSVQAGGTVQLTATARDANNNVLTGRATTWASSNTAIATVNGSGLVTAVAAGSATITATSGGVGGAATVTVTAAPPPSTSVFSDDFESGTLTKWNESNSTTQAIINDPAAAHSGNRFLRMTYGINGADGGWLNKYFTQGFTQLYVRYYVRFSSNWVGETKLIAIRGAPIGNPSASVGRAGICPTGQDAFSSSVVTDFGAGDGFPIKMYSYWQDMWADPNGQCWGRYGPTRTTLPYTQEPTITKNVWHKIEFAVKMNSSATAADGMQRLWIDGVKYGEWTGIRWGDPAFLNLGVLQINGSGNTTQLQTLDVDDLVLTTDFPTQSQP